MTFMDVHLTGLNDRNEEVATVFAFWWDGAALRRVLKDKLIDADPPPSWRGTFTSTVSGRASRLDRPISALGPQAYRFPGN